MTSRSLAQATQPTNTYVIDAESAAEQARLLDQDTLLTEAMGGPLSEQGEEALRGVRDVLDIACGPGGWVQRVARDYPQMQVTGIDLSPTMIPYAQAMAHVMRLDNAHFRVMDATGPLAFPDGRYHAITPMLRQFLRRAGFGDLRSRCYAVDHSSGTEVHRGFCENYQVLFKLGQPFLLHQGLATQEELDTLYEQALCEMLAEDFGALLYLLTVWGRKEEGMGIQTEHEALAHATLA